MQASELLEWLERQLAKSRRELQAREQAAETWGGGTAADWRASSRAASRMAGRPITSARKSERLKAAACDRRIAEKHRHDVAALEELIEIVTCHEVHPTTPYVDWLAEVDRIWELIGVDSAQSVGVRPTYRAAFSAGLSPAQAIVRDGKPGMEAVR